MAACIGERGDMRVLNAGKRWRHDGSVPRHIYRKHKALVVGGLVRICSASLALVCGSRMQRAFGTRLRCILRLLNLVLSACSTIRLPILLLHAAPSTGMGYLVVDEVQNLREAGIGQSVDARRITGSTWIAMRRTKT